MNKDKVYCKCNSISFYIPDKEGFPCCGLCGERLKPIKLDNG